MTVQQQAKLFGATHWTYNNGYAHFYHGNVFVGASNLAYLTTK